MIRLLAGAVKLGCSVALPLMLNLASLSGGGTPGLIAQAGSSAQSLFVAIAPVLDAVLPSVANTAADTVADTVTQGSPAGGRMATTAKDSASVQTGTSTGSTRTGASKSSATKSSAGAPNATGKGVPGPEGQAAPGESQDSPSESPAESESEDAGHGGAHYHGHYNTDNGSFSMGDTETSVPLGESNGEDIVSIGGRVVVRGKEEGDIVVIGGVLTISGEVSGNVVAVGSRVSLETGAIIHGSVISVAGSADRAPGVEIKDGFTSIDFPNLGRFATGHGLFRYLVLLAFWLTVFATGIRFLVVLIIAAIAPARIEMALFEPRPSWIAAFFLGLLVYIVGHLLALLFCIVFPIGVALWIALHVSIWMGLASISLHIGRAMGRTVFGRDLTYFGAILAGFSLFALAGFVPCFGWVLNTMASVTGLGLMLLTRYGSPKQLPRSPLPYVPPPVPPPPQPPL